MFLKINKSNIIKMSIVCLMNIASMYIIFVAYCFDCCPKYFDMRCGLPNHSYLGLILYLCSFICLIHPVNFKKFSLRIYVCKLILFILLTFLSLVVAFFAQRMIIAIF